MIVMSSLYLAGSAVAADAPSLEQKRAMGGSSMSIFDYLGTLVEGEEGWIDPLVLHEDDAAIESDVQTVGSKEEKDAESKSSADIEVSQ